MATAEERRNRRKERREERRKKRLNNITSTNSTSAPTDTYSVQQGGNFGQFDNYSPIDIDQWLQENFPDYDTLPEEYKTRLRNNPYINQYNTYSASNWDSTFKKSEVRNKLNAFLSEAMTYADTIYKEAQAYINSLPETQKMQQIAAGYGSQALTPAESTMSDSDDPAPDFSSTLPQSGLSREQAIQGLGSIVSMVSSCFGVAGGLVSMSTNLAQRAVLEKDAEFKEINNDLAAFKAAVEIASYGAPKPADDGPDVVVEGNETIEPSSISAGIMATLHPRIRKNLGYIKSSLKYDTDVKTQGNENIAATSTANRVKSTDPWHPDNYNEKDINFWRDYRRLCVENMKAKEEYQKLLTKLNVDETTLQSMLVNSEEYQQYFVSAGISELELKTLVNDYAKKQKRIGLRWLNYALWAAEHGDRYYQSIVTYDGFFQLMDDMGSDAFISKILGISEALEMSWQNTVENFGGTPNSPDFTGIQ